MLSIQKNGDRIGFIADFFAEVPQRPPIDVRKPERLLVIVGESRLISPSVRCLRKSFPATPHINISLCPESEPKQICLFDGQYSDVCHDFTPIKLIELVLNWLKRAALDQLHLPGQPLEPFMFTHGTIVLGRDIFQDDDLLECFRIDGRGDFLIVPLKTDTSIENKKEILFFPLKSLTPHLGVLIEHTPVHLESLCTLLLSIGVNLKTKFLDYLPRYYANNEGKQIIIGLQVPKKRTENGNVESTDYFAFFIDDTLDGLAKKFNISTKINGIDYVVPIINQEHKDFPLLTDVNIVPLGVRFHLSKNEARNISRLPSEVNPSLLLVGAGALGSQVAMILGRQGFGDWTIVDEDRLLPHNLPRHGLPRCYIGHEKAWSVAHAINDFFDGSTESQAIKGMFPGEFVDSDEYKKIDVLIDLSASESVVNHLARSPFSKPCLSGFVNHTAETGVILYEGQKRSVRLDDLYQQLYVEISSSLVHSPLNWFDKIPLLGETTVFYRIMCVLFAQTTTHRRKKLFQDFTNALVRGNGVRGVMVMLEHTPFTVIDWVEKTTEPEFDCLRQRAVAVKANIPDELRAEWECIRNRSIKAPTTLRIIPPQMALELIFHSFVVAMINAHVILGYPFFPGLLARSAFEEWVTKEYF